MQKFRQLWLGLVLATWLTPCLAGGTLEGPIRISSAVLNYDLQYWIYLPESVERPLPELYVTDGAGYLASADMVKVLDREIEENNIVPIAVIFLDARDPDDLTENRRYSQFMCKAEYGKFFVGELMPQISRHWTAGDSSTHRGLMGVSFGGINSACFGVMMPGVFQVLIMHSPASAEHLAVVDSLYKERPRHPSSIFISHGGESDNRAAAQRFVQTLQEKGYPVRHISNDGGHDWDNWAPLIDDSLRAFAGTREEDEIAEEEVIEEEVITVDEQQEKEE
jgi:enterochelin esterase-like enzyme